MGLTELSWCIVHYLDLADKFTIIIIILLLLIEFLKKNVISSRKIDVNMNKLSELQ